MYGLWEGGREGKEEGKREEGVHVCVRVREEHVHVRNQVVREGTCGDGEIQSLILSKQKCPRESMPQPQ